MTHLVPVADGALGLESRDEDAPLLSAWLPRPHPDPETPEVFVRLGPLPGADHSWLATERARTSTFSLGAVHAWVERESRRVGMAAPGAEGLIDLTTGSGVIDPKGSLDEACTMLTMAAGLLLSARRRVLLNAAAVRRPDTGVLLLTGDTLAGNSTTALTLARAPGWAWLSSDQVVLAAGSDSSVEVFSWTREPPEFGSANIGSLPWIAHGTLAGCLLPAIQPNAPSATRPAPGTAAMEVLIRQGAWIMSEPGSAKAALGVLSLAASFPAHFLDLGLDCQHSPERLAALVEESR